MLFVAGFMVMANSSHASSFGPQALMKNTVDKIMTILNHSQMRLPENKEERKLLVLTLVRGRFDFEEMSKRALAKEWKERSRDERKHFVDLFSQPLENTYIEKVDRFSGRVSVSYETTGFSFKV